MNLSTLSSCVSVPKEADEDQLNTHYQEATQIECCLQFGGPRCSVQAPAVVSFQRCAMKGLVPIPSGCVDDLDRAKETGIGHQVISVELKDGRFFDQVLASEGCIIESPWVYGNSFCA
jgi:hypothetical protein